jgi:hypothetical protein
MIFGAIWHRKINQEDVKFLLDSCSVRKKEMFEKEHPDKRTKQKSFSLLATAHAEDNYAKR